MTAAREAPDRVAVIDRDQAWTYAQLDASSNRLARRLLRLGIGPDARVGVWAPKSCLNVAVLQAVLRTGAAYVPIDPAMPARRADQILSDCDAQLLVTTAALSKSLPRTREVLLIDEAAEEAGSDAERPLSPPPGGGGDLAYILYTSGSTGTPKGVCLSHTNAVAFVEWAVRAVGLEGPAIVANHAAFNFDLSVFDLYGAFLSRSTVCLIPEEIRHAAAHLVAFLAARNTGFLYTVPSVLMLMMDHGELCGRRGPLPEVVMFAGEPFPVRSLRTLCTRWPTTRFFNFYGPTETNVCTAYEVNGIPDDQTAPVPIGRASCGNRVWAITDDGAVARAGERGELYVDGPTVMLGYWGQTPHSGPYRTGDLCVLRGDGCYEFVGRRDHMIKVRGHRVEPAEIEAALTRHPNVQHAVVVPIGEGLEQRLVAFVVPRITPAPTLIELKGFSARSLPSYMLIDRLEVLDALPSTPNGKIDRVALRRAYGVSGTSVVA